MSTRSSVPAVCVVLAAMLALTAPLGARAGDRELEILLVNMTPDAALTDAGRACMRDIEARVREEYAHVARMGETPVRRLVQHERDDVDFLAWPYADLRPVIERGDETWLDSVVLVDCRPDERRADVLVTSPARGATRISLRDVPIDRRRARWLAETFLRQSWNGFSP